MDMQSRLATFGFVVLRQFFDPEAARDRDRQGLADGILRDVPGRGDIRFEYVPMMTAEAPISLALLDRAETVAAAMFGGPVLPTRAKGTR